MNEIDEEQDREISETKSYFFEKISKVDPLARLTTT